MPEKSKSLYFAFPSDKFDFGALAGAVEHLRAAGAEPADPVNIYIDVKTGALSILVGDDE